MKAAAAPAATVAALAALPSTSSSPAPQYDCAGRSYAELQRLFHEQGYLIFTPCAFQQNGGQLLDALDQFTEHAARYVIRSNRGEGCQGSRDAENKKTCQFDVVGGERKPIQDGLMNMWTKNRATHDVATCREVRDLLTHVHDGKRASPFQTKNWYVGSMVPTHADLVFHDSWPQRGLLVGTWLALEDISPTAGPLLYYPGTHNATVWDFEGLNLTHAGNNTAIKNPYQLYANRLHDVVVQKGLQPVQALLKRGEMLVWRGNLLHGGATVLDWNKTRKAQTTHFYVEGSPRHWNPLASAAAGRWTKSQVKFIPEAKPHQEAAPKGDGSSSSSSSSGRESSASSTTSGRDHHEHDGHTAFTRSVSSKGAAT